MANHAGKRFWQAYRDLPRGIQISADEAFALFERNPHHPSLSFKRVGPYWAARITQSHRALAVEIPEGLLWFWIGSHDEYERLIRSA